MTPQELKNSILQLAIQGKLVEQRPEEGTAEELYQQIQAEKQRLIKEGKIKKEKPLPEIAEEEKPFDIPDSWKWVRISSVTILNPKNNIEDEQEVAFIPMACVSDGYRNEHTFEIRKWGEIKSGFTHFADNDIGIAKITPCFQNRKSVVFQKLKNGYGAGTTELSIVRTIGELLTRDYLLWFFKSEYFIVNGMKSFTGTAGQQRIHKDYLSMCCLPLPPLAEQKRIVAKIEELLPLIDRYEKAWSRLEEFNKRFPGDMQKSILQMAIQGKLVEQRSEEGTGEELYRQIQAEKQKLIKEGKIKKEKPLPEIMEEEKPFDIPDSWKWYRIGEVFNIVNGFTPLKSNPAFWTDRDIPWFTIEDVHRQGRFISTTEKYISKNALSKGTERLVPPNSVLLCCTASVGEYAYTKISLTTNQQFNALVTKPEFSNTVFPLFVFEFVRTLKDTLIKAAGKTTFNFLSVGKLSLLLFPLPPLAEQKRIVARIEELLPLVQSLNVA